MSTITRTTDDTEPDVAGVIAIVQALKAIEDEAVREMPLKDHDGLACFDYLYQCITENVLRCVVGTDLLPDDPRFHDPAFMAEFDIAFANRYLNAIGKREKLPWQPKCWQILLDHREDAHLSPLIFAVAGVNAHVNFDLPFAVVTACVELGVELDTETIHADYQLINQIFAEHMQQLRGHFESKFAKGFDKSWVSRVENWLGDRLVKFARDVAWDKAVEVWRVHDEPAKVTKLEKSRDRWVTLASRGLFALDRLPSMAFTVMHIVPGPPRRMAQNGRARTGLEATGQAR